MYQFSLRVRIDLQITALCSPGHNYPSTLCPTPPHPPTSPSHTVRVWLDSASQNLIQSLLLKTHGASKSSDVIKTPPPHPVSFCGFSELLIFARCHFYLISMQRNVRQSPDSTFSFSFTRWRLVEKLKQDNKKKVQHKLPVLELPLQVSWSTMYQTDTTAPSEAWWIMNIYFECLFHFIFIKVWSNHYVLSD